MANGSARVRYHDLRDQAVLVTGGAGMMGRALVQKLVELGARVRVADIQSRQEADMPDVDYWSVDLLDNRNGAIALTEGMHYIFHLAGGKGAAGIGNSHALDFMRVNNGTTDTIFKEVRKSSKTLKRFLFCSSVGAYPGSQYIFREDKAWDGPPHESDFFGGWGKRFGELMCEAAHKQLGVEYVIVRPTSTFGPWDRFDTKTGMVIPALMARLESGENPLVVKGRRSTMRDFLFAEDCADGLLAAMQYGRPQELYNLGTGKPFSILRLAEFLSIVAERDFRWEDATDITPQIRSMSMEKSERELGFHAKTQMEAALRKTFDWYREHKNYRKYDPFR